MDCIIAFTKMYMYSVLYLLYFYICEDMIL